jgi:hypothetical protein
MIDDNSKPEDFMGDQPATSSVQFPGAGEIEDDAYSLPVPNNYMDNDLTPDIYRDVPPRFIALKDNFAKQTVRNARRESYFAGPFAALTADEISKQQTEQVLGGVTETISPILMKADYGQRERFMEIYQGMLENHPKVPGQAPLDRPTALQYALAAFGMIFDPQHASEIAATPFNEQLRQHAIGTQQGQVQYDADIQARQERMRFNEKMMNDAGDMARDERDTQLGIEKFNIGVDQFNTTTQLNRENMERDDRRAQIEKAWAAYEKNPNEVNAAKIRALDKEYAPTPQEVQQAAQVKNRQNVQRAQQEWNDQVKTRFDLFGQVSEMEEGELNQARASIAAAYGVDVNTLLPAKSGVTLKRETFLNRKAEFAKNFKFKSDKQRDDLAIKRANLDLSKRRVTAYEKAVDAAVSRGYGMLEVSQYRAELAGFNATAKGFNDDIQKEINDVDKKIALTQGKLNLAKGDDRAKLDMELSGLREQRGWLNNQKEGIITDPTKGLFEQVMGAGAGIPPTQAQPQPTAQAPKPSFHWKGPDGGDVKPVRVEGLSGPIGRGASTQPKRSNKPVKKANTSKKVKLPNGWKFG